ncbi:hypothetical protein ACEPAH_178 [Sanghuangporus vaninii]
MLNFDQASSSWIELSPADKVNESPAPSSQTLPPFVIATWNIREDDRFVEYRHPYILRELFDKGEGGREKTIARRDYAPRSHSRVLLAHPTVRVEWVVTDLAHQLGICPNPYGTDTYSEGLPLRPRAGHCGWIPRV